MTSGVGWIRIGFTADPDPDPVFFFYLDKD